MTEKNNAEKPAMTDFATYGDHPPLLASVADMRFNLTGQWRYVKPVFEDKTPACQNACPAGNDIEAWIRLLEKNQPEKALGRLRMEEPFPAILGRVCFSFCQQGCNRQSLDQSVNIRNLERFLGDLDPAGSLKDHLAPENGARIGVVGSGPAGMSAAWFARLCGFEVTIYENQPFPGGILAAGIPAFRLPSKIVEAAFQGLSAMGVKLKTKAGIHHPQDLEGLGQTHDFLFLATGAHAALDPRLGHDPHPGVMSGLDFLKQTRQGNPPVSSGLVAVVGGGNTAMDAARTAVRLGAQTRVLYRRSEAEMPANAREIAEAKEEGVEFQFLTAPIRLETGVSGRGLRLTCASVRLGDPDTDGRRRPVIREGTEFHLNPDTVILAIGETPDLSYAGPLAADPTAALPVADSLEISTNGKFSARVFAGGDILSQSRTVVHAVASGKRAVIAMDCLRRGLDFQETADKIRIGNGPGLSFLAYREESATHPVPINRARVVGPDDLNTDYFTCVPPVSPQIEEADIRKTSFDPYEKGYTPDQAEKEAARCLHCGRCIECDNCLVFCPDMSVHKNRPEKFGYRFDYDYCKGCGICFSECPRSAISLTQ